MEKEREANQTKYVDDMAVHPMTAYAKFVCEKIDIYDPSVFSS